jgi:hypothetical protein
MTLDMYAGPFNDDPDAVAERLDAAAAAARADSLRTVARGEDQAAVHPIGPTAS